jgi:cardiolipin synthase
LPKQYTKHNRIRLIHGGGEYFKTLDELINNAVNSIFFQTYIFEEDQTGISVADSLIKASKRGVKVFLLLDGYASQHLSNSFIARIGESGIFFRWFSPLLQSRHFYFGRRLHHKVVVADAQTCLIGGVNISDRYNDLGNNKAWLDWAIYAEGEVALSVFEVCAGRATSRWKAKNKVEANKLLKVNPVIEECRVRMIVNDWVRGKKEISNSYLEMFKRSQSEIIIMSSYFLPGSDFRRKLGNAAKRNVRVRVILTQVADVALAKSAERYLYPWLFKKRIEVYEYTKAILHGKITVADQQWVSIGSYNFNELSAKASVEMNLEVDDAAFGKHVYHELDQVIQSDCVRITEEDYHHFGWLGAMQYRIAYQITRILLFIFTFYFKQSKS